MTQLAAPISPEELVLYCLATDCNFLCHGLQLPQVVQLLDEEIGLRRDSYDAQCLACATEIAVSKIQHTKYGLETEDPYSIWPQLRAQRETLVQAATKVLIVPTNTSIPVYKLFLHTAFVSLSCTNVFLLACYTFLDLCCLALSIKTWCDDWESFYHTINPPEHFQLKFHHNVQNEKRLDGLVTHKKTYKRVASHLQTWRSWFGCLYLSRIKRYQIRSCSDLKMSISVSKSLATSLHKVKAAGVIVDIGGGGMTTGSPWDPAWKSQALIDLVETRPIIYVTFDRRRLPECNGEAVLEDTQNAMVFLFDKDGIDTLVKAHYPNLEWCRTKIILTGESAGGFLALWVYLKWGQRIASVYLRYPLLREYRRDFGPYMGREIPFQEAAMSLFCLLRLLNKLYDIPPAIGRFPPDGMWPAYKTSCFKVWGRIWNAPYPMDLLQAEACLNTATKILVLHGGEDVQVPIGSSRKFVSILQNRGVKAVLKEIPSAAHGFDYDIPLLDPVMQPLRQMVEDLGIASN